VIERLNEIARVLSTVLLEAGVSYIVLAGPAIMCVKCRNTSHNPHDVQNLYCGFCKVFHTPAE